MIGKLAKQIKIIISNSDSDPVVLSKFTNRLNEGFLTREENPETHFCVFFAGFDLTSKKLLVGHHKKSGLWLFNGGHIEKNELPQETLKREIEEEWGKIENLSLPKNPALLTVSKIEHSAKRLCVRHYDIWYFVSINEKHLNQFDKKKLLTEFYEIKLMTPQEAKRLTFEPNTLKAIDYLKKLIV